MVRLKHVFLQMGVYPPFFRPGRCNSSTGPCGAFLGRLLAQQPGQRFFGLPFRGIVRSESPVGVGIIDDPFCLHCAAAENMPLFDLIHRYLPVLVPSGTSYSRQQQ